MKKFVLNADDFGCSAAINKAVSESYDSGLLQSVSLRANGDFFDDAVNNILPNCEGLGVGIHLNLTEGKSICSDLEGLTDANMHFNNSFFSLYLSLLSGKNTKLMENIEREFRRQIEKVAAKTKITHLDSHNHIHSIPPIFDLVCRLAKEYQINEVRTHFEKFYIVPDLFRNLNKKFIANLSKKLLLNLFSVINENTIHKYALKTNDYLIGITYSHNMDSKALFYGLKVIRYHNITVEAIIHPCRYEEGTIDNRFDEYMLSKNNLLKNKIEKMGFVITNYAEEKREEEKET